MRDGGRLSAAIAVLSAMDQRHRPAQLALKDWGASARYAGAKDRAFVSGLVLDVLRKRRSLGWRMGAETPRAVCLAVLRFAWGWPLERVAEATGDAPHGPGALTPDERTALSEDRGLVDAPAPVAGDFPDWLEPHMLRAFGDDRAAQGAALAERAPVDLRVNTLKATRKQVLAAISALDARPVERLPDAIRLPAPDAAERAAPVEAAPAFELGWFEVQDLGSQIAASMAGEVRGRKVLDLCAGGGGKTLALAATMAGEGRLYAYDADARRLTDTQRRAIRAGVTNLDVRSPLQANPLADLAGAMDLVFVDAPCTGSGTWRRHPDTKWRLKPAQLERRMAEQDAVLDHAASLVKTGGRIVYVTCSLFVEEDEDRVRAFLDRYPGFSLTGEPMRLSPLRDGCDGFFGAVLTCETRWSA